MVWTWLLLLPCSLAFKEYATSRSHPKEYTDQAKPVETVAMSSLSVAEPWDDWSFSAWIFLTSPLDTALYTDNPTQKAKFHASGLLSLDVVNISSQSQSLVGVLNEWFILITGSNGSDSYIAFRTRRGTLASLTATATSGIAAQLTSLTTFNVMRGSSLFSVKVM